MTRSLVALVPLSATERLDNGVARAVGELDFFARLPPGSPAVVAVANNVTAHRTGLARSAAAVLAANGRSCRLLIAPDLASTIRRGVFRRSGLDVAVDLGPRGERMRSVRLSAEIANAPALIAANDLRGENGARPTIVIGLWSRFAGWRERVGARLSPPAAGMAAEIALAVRPALILLAGEWRGLSLVVAASDQIAAELVGLALKRATASDGDEEIGPWQDPLVQRATDLDLGVRVPDQIALRAIAGGIDGEPVRAAFSRFVADIAGRIGVRDVTVDGAAVASQGGG